MREKSPNGVRLLKHHQADVRTKIQVVKLLACLQVYALTGTGYGKNAGARIKATEILLRKVLPDLTSIDGQITHKHEIDVTTEAGCLEAARRILFVLDLAKREQAGEFPALEGQAVEVKPDP